MSAEAVLAFYLQIPVVQNPDPTQHDMHLTMVFVGLIAFFSLIAAIAMVVLAIFGAKLLHRVHKIANLVEQKTGPILDKTHALIAELSPKIHSITANAEQMSYTVREKVDELSATVSELNQTVLEFNLRTKRQVSRVDGIISGVMATTEEVAVTIQEGIKGPVKQVAGVIAGLRAGLETLAARSPFSR